MCGGGGGGGEEGGSEHVRGCVLPYLFAKKLGSHGLVVQLHSFSQLSKLQLSCWGIYRMKRSAYCTCG